MPVMVSKGQVREAARLPESEENSAFYRSSVLADMKLISNERYLLTKTRHGTDRSEWSVGLFDL